MLNRHRRAPEPAARRAYLALLGILVVALAVVLLTRTDDGGDEQGRREEAKAAPSEWFFKQRAWPHDDINHAARMEAYERSVALRAEAQTGVAEPWDPAGPTNIGGRVADVACHPTDPDILYIGTAEGGVFKTTDGGQSWIPTFDFESSLSVGDLAIDPNDPDVLYVGTGEPNGGGGSVTYGGTGVFKTTNGGATWTNVGLPDSRHIGRVVVDPSNSSRVFVAVLGGLFSTNPERGVYRSTDAGGSWEQVLASNDSTGAIDVAVHPTDSNVVFAAMWERSRGPNYIDYGGPASGLFRSTDGGDSWQELTNGLPSSNVGRIGLSISESGPDIVYAIYADANPGFFMGVYKTTDGGDSWVQTNDGSLSNLYSSYGWWFGNIRVDPANPDRVFVLGLEFWRTTNGGGSWSEAGAAMHVDHHGLDFTPNTNTMFEGNDGGMYRSTNGGTIWTKLQDLPVTQFYTVEIDDQQPQRRYGGTQDNGTNRTLTGALDDWQNILGGDGFYCQVDHTNNSHVYAEYQYGGLRRSTNGGSTFLDGTGGQFGDANWNMPVMIDPTDPTVLYTGRQRVFRSANRASSWTAISDDLTDGPHGGNATFGTITTVAAAATDPDVLWAGTDDGNVWRTTNGGASWVQVDGDLPERWITRVAIDPTDAFVSYVTVSGFRWDEPLPHVFRSTDYGASWTDISSNLPEAPVNDIVIDPQETSHLFVATDFGVYASFDTGGSWSALGVDLPNVVVNDLELHDPTRTLVAGTYGRSMWTFDLDAVTSVGEGDVARVSSPRLLPVAPNPAPGGRASVRFTLPRGAGISVRVYDAGGRRVATLAEGRFGPGEHSVSWDGRDARSAPVPAGVYFVRLEGDGVARSRKVTVAD